MITLLNGETYGVDEILTLMVQDSFYYGHLGQHALSSSSLKMLLKSPKTYRNVTKYGQKESKALRDGKLLHWMILEPHKIDELCILDVSSKATKAYKEALSEHDEVYLRSEIHEAERLADALNRNEAANRLRIGKEYEVPAVEMIDGLAFRAKADILSDDAVIDIKSTQSVQDFRYSADKFGYDLQAWLYCKMFKRDKFEFLVIDKASTDIAIFETSEEFLQRGEDKFKQAVSNFKYFFQGENDLDQYVLRGIL